MSVAIATRECRKWDCSQLGDSDPHKKERSAPDGGKKYQFQEIHMSCGVPIFILGHATQSRRLCWPLSDMEDFRRRVVKCEILETELRYFYSEDIRLTNVY